MTSLLLAVSLHVLPSFLAPTYLHNTKSYVCVSHSVVSDAATPWTVAHQAPLFMEFSREEYWSGLPFSPPGDFTDPGIEPTSPSLAGEFFTTAPPGKPYIITCMLKYIECKQAVH